ncbi:PoNe immunity protein domain-containing protein [Pseudomonas sp. MWU13-2100]|uniref:PoNe immunity protein domain-containing protein n=1 Tax=Pseudomonas sp. MWU13-2100 TaxID=2935075 RepID=UPI00399BDCF6
MHPQPYASLLESLDLRRSEQQQRLLQYLKQWYDGSRGCYWHERHSRARGDHFGYWTFEAALVALLWKIDDTSITTPITIPKRKSTRLATVHWRLLKNLLIQSPRPRVARLD